MWKPLTSRLCIFSAERLRRESQRLHDVLRARLDTLLISEDHWTSNLFSDDLRTIEDYGRFSARFRTAMGPHIVDILPLGLSIALDFLANTVSNRNWMRSLITEANVDHELHPLGLPDTICRQRLRERNQSGTHLFQVSEAEYELFHPSWIQRGLQRRRSQNVNPIGRV